MKVDIVTSDDIKIYYTGKFQDFTAMYIIIFSLLSQAVGVHCAHGKGRTGTVISCYLVKHFKLAPNEAIEKLRSMRPGSVETSEQEEMVRTFAKSLNQ